MGGLWAKTRECNEATFTRQELLAMYHEAYRDGVERGNRGFHAELLDLVGWCLKEADRLWAPDYCDIVLEEAADKIKELAKKYKPDATIPAV